WHPQALQRAYSKLPKKIKENWMWWKLPKASERKKDFADLIESNPSGVDWHSPTQTRRILNMMTDINKKKVATAKKLGKKTVGCIYKRMRPNESGKKNIQRAEVRFEKLAGCLRTPTGGASRQLILVVQGKRVRSRLISSRETARLMGLPEAYRLPENYYDAYHLTGDGVVVPVVRHLARKLLEPIIRNG
ncbi:MAG TPA: DNA cytosine methyltransferase, partial [Candidatus Acidoferrum sp.]|nr:DNA cytosine methyltransferase [Candidatus Acidoferrum sp.]